MAGVDGAMEDTYLRILGPWIARWSLAPAGEPFATHTSVLLPVLAGSQPAMLKVATVPEEERGAEILAWWGGVGAARVLALEGEAMLMEMVRLTREAMRRAKQSSRGETQPVESKQTLGQIARSG